MKTNKEVLSVIRNAENKPSIVSMGNFSGIESKSIIAVCYPLPHVATAEENANRIVKAVNTHEELIEGLKKIANCQNSLTYYSNATLIDSVVEQAKELLKQAEQK